MQTRKGQEGGIKESQENEVGRGRVETWRNSTSAGGTRDEEHNPWGLWPLQQTHIEAPPTLLCERLEDDSKNVTCHAKRPCTFFSKIFCAVSGALFFFHTWKRWMQVDSLRIALEMNSDSSDSNIHGTWLALHKDSKVLAENAGEKSSWQHRWYDLWQKFWYPFCFACIEFRFSYCMFLGSKLTMRCSYYGAYEFEFRVLGWSMSTWPERLLDSVGFLLSALSAYTIRRFDFFFSRLYPNSLLALLVEEQQPS